MTTENHGTKADLENGGDRFTETRSMLKKLAMAHGADTAIGRAAHNLLEMTENYAKSTDGWQKSRLAWSIDREKTRLNDLVSQLH